MINESPFEIKVYTKAEMAKAYVITAKQFAKWMRKMEKLYPDIFPAEGKHAHLLTPVQVKKIIEHFGPPR